MPSRIVMRISYVKRPEEVEKALRILDAAYRRSIIERLSTPPPPQPPPR